jgi:LAO/AO transport system kinase
VSGRDRPAEALVEEVLAGKHRALARVITHVENRTPGYRAIVGRLHTHATDTHVIGITGSPGAGKSTLVDKMATRYRDRGLTVGIIAIDPSSPYTGGAVLGDRIRMASNVGDMDVFFRSMSARGSLGGLSTATTDAITALDAFGKDRIIVETVGAGQNEIDIVRTADSVVVLVPPSSGDEVQMLKAGILEIGDLFAVNKADLEGTDRTVMELEEMIMLREDNPTLDAGHHGATGADPSGEPDDREGWEPPVLETVAETGAGVDDLLETLADHRTWLDHSGMREQRARGRIAGTIRTLLREDANGLVEAELEALGGVEAVVDRIRAGETDPYTAVDRVFASLQGVEEAEPASPADENAD